MEIKKIFFLHTQSHFAVFKNIVYHYAGKKRIRTKDYNIDQLLINPNLYNQIANSELNLVSKVFRTQDDNLEIIEEKISYSHLKEVREAGRLTEVFSKEITPGEITHFYKFEVRLIIKGVCIFPGQYMSDEGYPEDVVISFSEKEHWNLGRKQIPAPWEPRFIAHLVPVRDIDKIIGVKRFKDTNWIGTEKEGDFIGEEETIELDLHHMDNKALKVFEQHEAFDLIHS